MNDIAQKRAVLFSARMQFSPETQPVKDTAIDRYVEQVLLLGDSGSGMSLRQIEEQAAIQITSGALRLNFSDIDAAIKRLERTGRIKKHTLRNQVKFMLVSDVYDQLWNIHNEAQSRITAIVKRLFRDAETGPNIYEKPFLEFLCMVFSQLGDAYVQQIRGEITADNLLSYPTITNAVETVASRYSGIDSNLFRNAMFSFFRESEPDYDQIKWNFAQHHYVIKVLGLDPSGYLLSKEVFGDAELYLDTNIVIHALADNAQHHTSFDNLSKACEELGIKLKVTQITLNELQRVVDYQRMVIPQVAEQIPAETAEKVRGVFFEMYRAKAVSGDTVDIDDLFKVFDEPMQTLSELYDVSLVDDLWFIEEEYVADTKIFIDSIQQEYSAKRHHSKSYGSALHDALMLRWIGEERHQNKHWTWLVTLDTSLPRFLPGADASIARPMAITLDALLQWLSPLGLVSQEDEVFSMIFGEAISYQLLSTSFFDIKDFHVFAMMDWSCKQLPAQDVEDCVRYLRANASELNPANPIDREKLARELSKYFADPSREYHREVQRLEKEAAEMHAKYEMLESKLEDRDKNLEELNELIEKRKAEDTAIQTQLREEKLAREKLENHLMPELNDLRSKFEIKEKADEAIEAKKVFDRIAFRFSIKWSVALFIYIGLAVVIANLIHHHLAPSYTLLVKLGLLRFKITLSILAFGSWLSLVTSSRIVPIDLKYWHPINKMRGIRNWMFGILIAGLAINACYDIIKSLVKDIFK